MHCLLGPIVCSCRKSQGETILTIHSATTPRGPRVTSTLSPITIPQLTRARPRLALDPARTSPGHFQDTSSPSTRHPIQSHRLRLFSSLRDVTGGSILRCRAVHVPFTRNALSRKSVLPPSPGASELLCSGPPRLASPRVLRSAPLPSPSRRTSQVTLQGDARALLSQSRPR